MNDVRDPSGAAGVPEVRIAGPVLSKLAVAAGLEVPGIQDAEDYFLGAAPGSSGHTSLYLRFSTVEDADLPHLRRLLREHVRDRLRWFTGVEIDAIEVELIPSVRPVDHRPRPLT